MSAPVEHCDECGLPQYRDPEGMPSLDLNEQQAELLHEAAQLFDEHPAEALHQLARAFDTLASQVPAETPYRAADFVHWLLLERRIRSRTTRSPEAREHIAHGARRRWQPQPMRASA